MGLERVPECDHHWTVGAPTSDINVGPLWGARIAKPVRREVRPTGGYGGLPEVARSQAAAATYHPN